MLQLNNTKQTKLLNLNNLSADLKSVDDEKLLLQLEDLLIHVISDSYKRVFADHTYYTSEFQKLFLCKSVFLQYNVVERSFEFVAVTSTELKDLDDNSVFVPVALENKMSTTKKWTQILSDKSDTDIAIDKIAKGVLKLAKSRMRRMLSVYSKEVLSGDFSHIRLTGLISENQVEEPFALQANIGYFSPKFFTFDEIIQIAKIEADGDASFVQNLWEHLYRYYFNGDADELFNNVLKLKITKFDYSLRFIKTNHSTLTDELFDKFKEFLGKIQLADIIKFMEMYFTKNEMIFEYVFNTYSVDELKKYVPQLVPLIAGNTFYLHLDFTKLWNVFRDDLLVNDARIDEYQRDRIMNIQNFVISNYNFILDDVYSSSNLQDDKVLDINSLRRLISKPFVINKNKVLQHVNKYLDKMPKLPYFDDMRKLLIELKEKLVNDEIKEFPFDKLFVKYYRQTICNVDTFESVFADDDTKRMSDYVMVAADK